MSTQRRSYGFGTPDPSQAMFPRIAPPPGLLTGRNGDEKHSRFSPRSIAFSHRIWVLITVLVFVFLCTRILSPTHESVSHSFYSTSNLIPRDYLNSSDSAPFDFCPVFGPGDKLAEKHGVYGLTRTRLHTGSGARVQRIIRKALSGQPVTISVLGGSSEFYTIFPCII